jgi:MoxR-like ATPase
MVRTVTVDEVMDWGPCDSYPRERVEELWAGLNLTALEILDLKVPGEDRLWAVLRNEFFTDAELRELACDYAESVIGYYEREFPGDDRPRNAIRVARRFARGDATRDELSAALSAADAARSAARSAADAAWSAADAARSAARSAADAAWSAANAAWSATLSAAGRAAWNEQMEKQIELARQVLRGKREG